MKKGVLLFVLLGILIVVFSNGVKAQTHLTCATVNTGGKPCVEITSCGILDQTNAYYLLMNDVLSEQTCFWFSAEDIILDLNQYTIYYDQLNIPNIPYQDFEVSDVSELIVVGWDLSGAPGAYIATELKSITSKTLHLPNAGGSVILSPSFVIPRANYAFVASTFAKGLTSAVSNLTIDFVRTDANPIYCGYGLPEVRYNSFLKIADEELGGVACDIRTVDTPEVRIRITTTGPMLIDYVDFRGFLHPALVAASNYNPNHQYFADKPASVNYISGKVEAKNGKIVQGNARSGKAIVGYGVSHFVLDDLEIIMQNTPNNKGIEHIGYYGDVGVTNSLTNTILEVPTVGVFKRDIIGSAIHLYGSSIISNNIIRTDTSGVVLRLKSAETFPTGNLISENKIEMGFAYASMARNHYGIWGGGWKPVFRDNVLTGQGQGGINLVNAYEGEVYNNIIDMKAKCGLRFGATKNTDRLTVAGLVIRDNPSINSGLYSIRNKLYNNSVTMTIDPGLMEPECRVRAIAFWKRNRYVFNNSKCGDNQIYNNTFTAINLQDNLNSFGTASVATAMSFECYMPEVPEQKEKFFNNVLESNNVLYYTSVCSSSGGGHLDKGVDIYNNIMRKIDVGVEPASYRMRSFENILNWDIEVTVRDNIWENTNIHDYWIDTHSAPIRFNNTIIISVTNQDNNPIPNALVQIRDANTTLIRTGATDSQGKYETILTDFEVLGYNNHKSYNPYTITVTKDGYDAYNQEIIINSFTELFWTLTGLGVGCSPADTTGDDIVDISELLNYISQWKSGSVLIGELLTAIGEWKNGC